jgi:4-hydroxyphenylpyruvate dioxygenase-like putative hemolysin
MNTKELKKRLGLKNINQIGVVVKNMEKAVDYYSTTFNVGPFTVYDFVPEKHWFMEEPSYLKLRLGKAMWDNIELELIEPLSGRSLHKEFLEKHGEGLQHLGFNVDNYIEVFNGFIMAGFKPLMRCDTYVETYKGNLKACYFDTRAVGGVIFEIIWKSWLMKK